MRATTDTGLARYLELKGAAIATTAAARPDGASYRETISARCTADDLTGVRKLQIRDWQYIGDSGPDMGGWGLGPSSPELLCGVVSTCLVHTYLIAASTQGIPLESLSIEVVAENNDARFFGVDTDDPPVPFGFRAFVSLSAPDATAEQIAGLHRHADDTCPVMKVLRNPTTIELVVAAPGVIRRGPDGTLGRVSETDTDTALHVARETAAAMEHADAAARDAGVRLVDVGPGWASVALTVAPRHLNGHGICHGGYVFLLADAAFAFACNSFGVSTVAAGADVTFLRPAAPGDELVARAEQRAQSGRSGVYDVTVRCGDVVVAEFRGRSRTVPGLPAPGAVPTA